MTIITISRFTMSGGERLAKCLSEKLGIPAISREVITQVADQFDISEALLWEKLEKTKHGAPAERSLYMAAVQLALAERAREGPFIYHGLAGHFLLKGIPNILKVGIVAPLKLRAERLMKEKDISLDEAVRSIQRWDERRSKWVRFLYDVDWLNPSLYDLVINIASISVESACELVVCTMNQKEFEELHDRQELIEEFVLASRVKVQLALNRRTKGLDLDVEAADQAVRVTGRVLTGGIFHWAGKESTRNDLVEVAKTVPGVQKVIVDLDERAVPLD